MLRIVGREVTRDARLGPGFVVALSRSGDGSLWLIRMMDSDPSLGTMRSVTQRSVDGGATWQEAGTSPEFIGIAFDGDRTGYAWSESVVYQTGDNGTSWRGKEIGQARFARGNSSASPRLGPSGYLWAPSAGTRAGAAKLIRIASDLSLREVAAWTNESIAGVAPLNDREALVALNDPHEARSRVVRVAPDRIPVDAWHAADASVGDMYVRGDTIVLACVVSKAPGGYFQAWPTYLVVSRDRGRTWERQDNAAEATSLCLSDEGVWALSETKRAAWFSRFP